MHRGRSLLFAASGARGFFTSGALQRQFRDAHAINSHLAFNFDAAGTDYGRVALGLPVRKLDALRPRNDDSPKHPIRTGPGK